MRSLMTIGCEMKKALVLTTRTRTTLVAIEDAFPGPKNRVILFLEFGVRDCDTLSSAAACFSRQETTGASGDIRASLGAQLNQDNY